MIEGGISQRQIAALKEEIGKRDLKPRQRQRLLWRIAKYGVIAAAKRNQRQQTDPDGTPWPARKRGKKKMLRGLPRLLAVRENREAESVTVYLRGKGDRALSAGVLGQTHATGAEITGRASSQPRRQQEGPATRKQAARLRKLGFKRRDRGRWVNAPASWIMQNMSEAQAGVVIRKLSGEPAKQTWKIVLPARAFLGVNDQEFNKILTRQLQAIDFGWQVTAQDIRGKV